uniref:Uncharacterized protein n=1 Tax=Meloidogyne incognita TaxID=6306 RepID=A0A914NCU5_MELIC
MSNRKNIFVLICNWLFEEVLRHHPRQYPLQAVWGLDVFVVVQEKQLTHPHLPKFNFIFHRQLIPSSHSNFSTSAGIKGKLCDVRCIIYPRCGKIIKFWLITHIISKQIFTISILFFIFLSFVSIKFSNWIIFFVVRSRNYIIINLLLSVPTLCNTFIIACVTHLLNKKT